MIDQSTVDRIFEASQIIDVIQDFISLKKKGVNYLGNCPFHHEKTPSFTVSPAKNIYKCFGCGKGGNSVNFVMEHEHLSFYEALKYLAKKYHIEISEREATAQDIEKQNERDSLLIVTQYAKDYFTDLMMNSEEGKMIGISYFKERGFRDDTIEKFQLGYASSQKDAFTKNALSKGYKKEYLVASGLTIEKEDYRFDRFAGRAMFPIHSLTGKIIGFGGRILKTDKNTAKYLNSPESEIYHKSKVLYGMFFAKRAITQVDKCFLVEGYTDVISMHQAGIENVVASSGTSLTVDQIKQIKRFTLNITILYDGDSAGIKASLRGIDMILEEGMNVKIVLLPEGEDPDSYSRSHSATEVNQYISQNEKDFILFKTQLLLEESKNDPVKKAALINDIVQSISIIPNAITRSVYIKECATRLNTNEDIINNEVNKNLRKKFAPGEIEIVEQLNTAPQEISTNDKLSFQLENNEKDLIKYIVKFGNLIINPENENLAEQKSFLQHIIEQIENDEIIMLHPVCKKIFSECSEIFKKENTLPEKYFIQNNDPEINKLTAEYLFEKYKLSKIHTKNNRTTETDEDIAKRGVYESLLNYKAAWVHKMIFNLDEKLKDAQNSGDGEAMQKIMEEMTHLNKIKLQISALNKRVIG